MFAINEIKWYCIGDNSALNIWLTWSEKWKVIEMRYKAIVKVFKLEM